MSRSEFADWPDVGGQIRKARDAAGISQVELAKRLNRGERTIQAWERNERSPRRAGLSDLAELLGQPIAYFYGDGEPVDTDSVAA